MNTEANANANIAASPAMNQAAYAGTNTYATASPAMAGGPTYVGTTYGAPSPAMTTTAYGSAAPVGYSTMPASTTYTTTNTGVYPETGGQKPSALKGNIEAVTGKFQHNPEKVYQGNMMVAMSSEQKAARFEAKALEWEQKGNLTKAQKNRDKATRYRLKAANKITAANNAPITAAPKGAVAAGGAPVVGTSSYATTTSMPTTGMYTEGRAVLPTGTTTYPDGSVGTTTYVGSTTTGTMMAPGMMDRGMVAPGMMTGTTVTTTTTTPFVAGNAGVPVTGMTTKQMDRVAKFESKALAAERNGNLTRANKNRDKANRVRSKAGVAPVGSYPLTTAVPFTNASNLTATGLPLQTVPGTVPVATMQPGVVQPTYVNAQTGATTY